LEKSVIKDLFTGQHFQFFMEKLGINSKLNKNLATNT